MGFGLKIPLEWLGLDGMEGCGPERKGLNGSCSWPSHGQLRHFLAQPPFGVRYHGGLAGFVGVCVDDQDLSACHRPLLSQDPFPLPSVPG
jgi:hypothetical protein